MHSTPRHDNVATGKYHERFFLPRSPSPPDIALLNNYNMANTREGFLWSADGKREGLHTDAVLPGTHDIKQEYDVVIIGAGWAGITAARDLSEHTSLSVLIIEGRDRIGGRTWTAKERGQEFEMGGNWVSAPSIHKTRTEFCA